MLFCEPIPYLKSPIKCKTLLLTLDWVSWKDELDKTWLVITSEICTNYCTILSIFKKSFRVEVSLFLFCSGQVFFERTPGSLLRPVQGTSLREDPWRPPVSIQNFLFKMTSSPRALQIHPPAATPISDLFGYTQLKNKIIFLQNDKIIIMNYPYFI